MGSRGKFLREAMSGLCFRKLALGAVWTMDWGGRGEELRQRQYPGPGLEAPMPVGALETLPVLPHPRPGLLSLSPAAGGWWEEQGWQS